MEALDVFPLLTLIGKKLEIEDLNKNCAATDEFECRFFELSDLFSLKIVEILWTKRAIFRRHFVSR